MTGEPRVLLESWRPGEDGASWAFDACEEIVTADRPDEVRPALARIERAVAAGRHAAGFISYEAAPGLRPDFITREGSGMPLLWFGVFRERHPRRPQAEPDCGERYEVTAWEPSIGVERYAAAVARVRDYIAAGDTYQVNLTFRQRFRFAGVSFGWYRALCRSQRAPFCAYIDTGRWQILSASPELFFKRDGDRIEVRPMKGTIPRGRWPEEDDRQRELLKESAKDRAENLMIVDLLRNDLGQIARVGSVTAESLFDVMTLPTLHQMTSTVTAACRPGTGFTELLEALFPCGSVTGAPKRRTMEIIRGLEDGPRGVYTGCIGYLSPGNEAVFSVAIRTAVIDGQSGRGELGIGSGVTWDSRSDAEYAECIAKAAFARTVRPAFQLLETLLLEEGVWFLKSRHLARLGRTASYFGYPFDLVRAEEMLAETATSLPGRQRVRLLLYEDGGLTVESVPVAPDPADAELRVAFAPQAVDSREPFLYHKTTHRPWYADLPPRPDCIDRLFVNERGEVTEGTIHNVVARLGGELVTPPIESGLLPGVFREELLATGAIRERGIRREELAGAEELFLINSVRRWRRVRLVD